MNDKFLETFIKSFPDPFNNPVQCNAPLIIEPDHLDLNKSPNKSHPCARYAFCDPENMYDLTVKERLGKKVQSIQERGFQLCSDNNPKTRVQQEMCSSETCPSDLPPPSKDHVQLALVTIPQMHHLPAILYPSPSSDSYSSFLLTMAADFTESLHNKYSVGSPAPSCSGKKGWEDGAYDLGVLLFLSEEDRTFHVSVGTGLKTHLTPRRKRDIVSLATGEFKGWRVNKWEKGLSLAIDKIGFYLSVGPETWGEWANGFGESGGSWLECLGF